MKLLGVSLWQGWRITFSDGMCTGCAVRARAEWSLPAVSPDPIPARPSRWSLRPDFALASLVLVAAAAVTFGLLVGSPARQTVSQSPATEPSLVASRDRAEPPTRTLAPKSSQPASTGAAAPAEPSAAGAALPRGPSAAVDAPRDGDRAGIARLATPVRVARAATKRRKPLAPSELLPIAMPVEPVEVVPVDVVVAAVVAPGPRRTPPPPARWMSTLYNIPVQAP